MCMDRISFVSDFILFSFYHAIVHLSEFDLTRNDNYLQLVLSFVVYLCTGASSMWFLICVQISMILGTSKCQKLETNTSSVGMEKAWWWLENEVRFFFCELLHRVVAYGLWLWLENLWLVGTYHLQCPLTSHAGIIIYVKHTILFPLSQYGLPLPM